MMDSQHQKWLRRCLELGSSACGFVGSGAMVGAVLVRDDTALAEAIHPAYGQFHAERMLLTQYHPPISSSDTLYVNLEPCVPSPTKKTPACVDIILERNVKRLVYGMVDPDERVRGRGVEILCAKGVHVEGPGLDEESRSFNRGFVSVRTKGRPWCGVVSGPEKLGVELAAWKVLGSTEPYAALLVNETELSQLTLVPQSANAKGENRAQLVVFDRDYSLADGTLRDLSRTYRTLLVGHRGMKVYDSNNGIREALFSEEIQSPRELLFSLGVAREFFAGVTAILAFQGGALGCALKEAGLVDQKIE